MKGACGLSGDGSIIWLDDWRCALGARPVPLALRVRVEVVEHVSSAFRDCSARTIRGSKVVVLGVLLESIPAERGYERALGLTGDVLGSPRTFLGKGLPLVSSGLPRVVEYRRGTAKGMEMTSSMFLEGDVDVEERGMGMLDDLDGRVLILPDRCPW